MPVEGMSWEENPPTLMEYHPARSALVPGQHAILAAAGLAGAEAGQPLPIAVRHSDVSRFAGLDGDDGDRRVDIAFARARPGAPCTGPARAARCSAIMLVMIFAPKIASSARCADAAVGAAILWRRRAVSLECRGRDVVLVPVVADHGAQPYGVSVPSLRACGAAAPGTARSAKAMPFPGVSPV